MKQFKIDDFVRIKKVKVIYNIKIKYFKFLVLKIQKYQVGYVELKPIMKNYIFMLIT